MIHACLPIFVLDWIGFNINVIWLAQVSFSSHVREMFPNEKCMPFISGHRDICALDEMVLMPAKLKVNDGCVAGELLNDNLFCWQPYGGLYSITKFGGVVYLFN